MKHRSTIAFILLAAALFAAPQLAHDVLSLKSAVGARLRGEIVRALLNLSASGGPEELAARPAAAQPAAVAQESTVAQQDAPRSKSCERRANPSQQPDAQPQEESQEQLAMLVSPSLMTEETLEKSLEAGASVVDPNVVDTNVIVSKAAEASRQALARVEIASLAPRSADVFPPSPVVGEKVPAGKCRAAQNKRESEAKRQAAVAAARSLERSLQRQLPDAALLRRFANMIPASYEFKVDGAQRYPAIKVTRRVGATPVSCNTPTTKQAALNVPVPLPQAPPAE
jgi:hypothetical protein